MQEQKDKTSDLPVQNTLSHFQSTSRSDTPQLDLQENDSALTTMRRIGCDDNHRNMMQGDVTKCTLFATEQQTSKKLSLSIGKPIRHSENTDPSTLEQIEPSVSSHREEIISLGQQPAIGLTFLYSSVKSALKDNLNMLDFSKRHQDTKKQQLRYYVNSQDSEASIVQDNDQTVTLNSASNYERRQSYTTEKGIGSTPFDYTHGEIKLDLSASMRSIKRYLPNEKEIDQQSVKTLITKRQLMLQEEAPVQCSNQNQMFTQMRQSQNNRAYHTFSNEQQTTEDTLIRLRESVAQSNASVKKTSSKQLQQSIDPSTPIFSCQKPTSNALYQSMHMPQTSTHDDNMQNEGIRMQDPQIISRTLGVMKLNSSSSCQSLDQQLREEVFNLTIKRPQVVEVNDSIEQSQPQIEVSTEANYLKPKNTAPKKKVTPSSAGFGGNFSKTQKLYLGGLYSHQQSKFTAASRILSPLSQKSGFLGQISSSTTPKIQQKSVTKIRPKSTGSTNNTANTSTNINLKKKSSTTLNSRSSIAPSFSKQSSQFNYPTQKLSKPKSVTQPKLLKSTTKKVASNSLSRQPAFMTAQQSSSSFIKINPRCPSSLTVSNSIVKIGQTRTFSPTMFNTTGTVIKQNTSKKSQTITRPQTSSSSFSTSIQRQTQSIVKILPKKKKQSKSPYNTMPSTTNTFNNNITLKNQSSKSSIVSFKNQRLFSPNIYKTNNINSALGKCNIIRMGLQKRGQSISDKNEVVAQMMQEKKQLGLQIVKMKKEIIQSQKQVKAVKDNNRQIGDDIVKLGELVLQKADRNQNLQKEVVLARRDVRSLQQDCEDLKQEKSKLILKIEHEYQLMDVVQRLIVNLKKQTNEIRREKERLQIAVRGEQRKAIDVISKRKTLITEESEKIYMDFKDTIGNNNNINNNCGSQSMLQGHYSSRSQLHTLHTPKGLNRQ